MRVEDAQQVQSFGFDPIERLELFVWIHDESSRTLGLIPHKHHRFDPLILAS
jgi:hypothetical protein